MIPDNKLRYLTLKLTDKCNLNCKMCGQVYAKNRNGKELAFDLIKNCLHDIDTIEHIYLFGGEPLLYSKFNELLELIREKNIPAMITTNGMLLDRYVEKIVMTELRDIDISIDSHKSDVFKNIRINGNLNIVLDNLDLLFEHKAIISSSYPRVGISCVILPDNCLELVEYYEFFIKRYPLLERITFEFPMETNESCGKETNQIYEQNFDCQCNTWRLFYEKTPYFTLENLETIGKQMEILSNCNKVIFQGDSEINSLTHMIDSAENRKCNYPYSTLTILENGQATFCTDFPDIILGNISEDSIKSIWNGEKANQFRSYMDRKGFFPICKCCTHYGDIIKMQKEEK